MKRSFVGFCCFFVVVFFFRLQEEAQLPVKSLYKSREKQRTGQWPRNDELLKTDFFHYVVREHPEHCTIMHKWILTWILPTLFYRSHFYLIFLVGALSLACNDMNPEQMATNVNCSSPERHTRSYDYMEGGNVRVRRLFCRTQWYVKIDKRGKIKGVRDLNSNYSE